MRISVRGGQIQVRDRVYSYEQKDDEVNVSDETGNLVFHIKVPGPDCIISGVNFSFYYNSFIAFKTEWKSWNKTYQLILYTEDHEIPLIIDSQTPSYPPVLIEHRGTA